MKPTDFSMHLTAFLSDYLPVQKNVSRNTIKSYRVDYAKLCIIHPEEARPGTERSSYREKAFLYKWICGSLLGQARLKM